MLRGLCLVLLALMLAQGLGFAIPAEADGCIDRCAGEEDDGQCPPDCAWCSCCPGSRALVVDHIELRLAPERIDTAFVEPVPHLTAPDPHEISHVPRLLS
jgi:hypothetical protein